MTLNPSALKSFFVFNPKLGQREGQEHEKILFFYPEKLSLGEKTNNVGLSEAMIYFTQTFSPDRPCNAVHRQKHTCAFFNPEPDYWIVLMVRNPSINKSTGKDAKPNLQFIEDETFDNILQSVVRQSYKIFKLLNGQFQGIVQQNGMDALRASLDRFMPAFISSLNFDSLDLFTAMEGIQFLPVDKNVFLRIQCFINLTEDHFSKIQYAAFLYRDHLLWSGLDQDDMRGVYSYLTSRIAVGEPNSWPNKIKGRAGFVTGPDDVNNPTTAISAPRIFVGPKCQDYYLIVYELADVTSLFLLEKNSLEDRLLFQQLDSFISPHINFIAPVLAEHYSSKSGTDEQYRYIYFNHMNLAVKTSLKQRGAELPRDTLKILNEIHSDFEDTRTTQSTPAEVLIRTTHDRWVVARKSDQREFYVIFESKNANLLEINEEVKKLSSSYFNSIFID